MFHYDIIIEQREGCLGQREMEAHRENGVFEMKGKAHRERHRDGHRGSKTIVKDGTETSRKWKYQSFHQ